MRIQVRHTISTLVKERDNAVVELTKCIEAASQLAKIMSNTVQFGVNLGRENFCLIEQDNKKISVINKLIKEIDSKFWNKTIQMGEFRELMNSKRIDELNDQLCNNPPAFTFNTATATLTQLIEERPKLLTELVESAFKGRSKTHNSNGRIKIDSKQIFSSIFNQSGHTCSFSHSAEIINDMCKAISILTGIKRSNVINELKLGEDLVTFEGKVKFKTFKNGNVHMFILDEDLTNKLNDVLNHCYKGQIGSI